MYHDPLRHSPRLTICPPLFIFVIWVSCLGLRSFGFRVCHLTMFILSLAIGFRVPSRHVDFVSGHLGFAFVMVISAISPWPLALGPLGLTMATRPGPLGPLGLWASGPHHGHSPWASGPLGLGPSCADAVTGRKYLGGPTLGTR